MDNQSIQNFWMELQREQAMNDQYAQQRQWESMRNAYGPSDPTIEIKYENEKREFNGVSDLA